jgi:2-succinyl-5-enolpyruvyl-6-hydroxy-3-cyclohexene-1-carboxylate synthase
MGAEREGLTPGAVLARYVGAFVDELAAAGVEDVCLCPGSRSTPLALVIRRHPTLKVWTHLDERSCAFFALGMAKASRRPVAVLCSSGTATVNFAPAVYEAFNAQVPLIVLTADRPQDLRDVGATQTIDQDHLYGASAKWFVEMLLPETSGEALRYVRVVAARAVATALEPAAGPVHLNFPFREPLLPDKRAEEQAARFARRASITHLAAARRPDPETLGVLIDDLTNSSRGLIVCGPQDDPELAREAVAVSELYGYPVFADVLSQVRCGPHHGPTVIGAYDSFLRDRETVERLAPDFILRLGATPVSKPLSSYLQRYRDVPQILVTPDSTWRDPDFAASYVIPADASAFLADLAGETQRRLFATGLQQRASRADWLYAWQDVERETLLALSTALKNEERVSEPGAISELAAVFPENTIVFAGNSMPVRDLDTFFPGSTRPARFLANRGASGIDGVVSAALGAAAKGRGRLVLLIGDISFYHDMNGLLAAKRYGSDVTIVLLNNDGGGIFSFLPQYDDPEHYEDLFGTPHGLDFSPAAALYGLPFERVETSADYRQALQRTFERAGTSIIEVRTDRDENLRLHQRLWQDVAAALHRRDVK